jgi:hypothetical protein
LRRVLDAHPDVTIPPPEWIFHFIYPHLYSYGDLTDDGNMLTLIQDCLEIPVIKKHWNLDHTPEQILASLEERSFRAVYAAFFHIYRTAKHTPLWGAKTPSNVFWFNEISRMFPNARFVLLYRDGRDVGVDLCDVQWGPQNLYTACLLWRSYVQAMMKARQHINPERCYELRYESLVADPEGEIEKLCRFLKIDYRPEMLRYYEKSGERFLKESYHAKTNKPITDEYVGMYKRLSLEERQLQITLLGDTLLQLGYSFTEKPRKIGFWERELYLEEDRHGGLILEGAVEYKNRARLSRIARKEAGIWSDDQKNDQSMQDE